LGSELSCLGERAAQKRVEEEGKDEWSAD